MDSSEFDLNNALLSSTSSSKSISISNDYETDLRLAAQFGRCLLEQNQELRNYAALLQKQIDEIQSDMKILEGKLNSTREQLDEKCRESDILDAANYDLEQELAAQRRDNEKNRQQIKDLFGLCETTRKQCQEIEQEYERFRSKQIDSFLTLNSPLGRQRAHSFDLKNPSNKDFSSSTTTMFDLSSTNIYKSHLRELKSQIETLTTDCNSLTEQLDRSDQEKRFLIERLSKIERQRRDENYSFENQLNHYRKIFEKYEDQTISKKIQFHFSSNQKEISLYDEVRTDSNQNKSIYEPTDFKALFKPIYEKLKFYRN